jgi:predicted nuclease of predicted toxin-antitoxin system
MKFLIDAQLPYRLKYRLTEKGFDAVHTQDLPEANETEDLNIAAIAEQENRNGNFKRQRFFEIAHFER